MVSRLPVFLSNFPSLPIHARIFIHRRLVEIEITNLAKNFSSRIFPENQSLRAAIRTAAVPI
jgi:sucrose-6-phosphate hydrolase SacC (GH32 family)